MIKISFLFRKSSNKHDLNLISEFFIWKVRKEFSTIGLNYVVKIKLSYLLNSLSAINAPDLIYIDLPKWIVLSFNTINIVDSAATECDKTASLFKYGNSIQILLKYCVSKFFTRIWRYCKGFRHRECRNVFHKFLLDVRRNLTHQSCKDFAIIHIVLYNSIQFYLKEGETWDK